MWLGLTAGTMPRHCTFRRAVEGLNAAVLFIIQSALNGGIEAACGEIGLNASVDRILLFLAAYARNSCGTGTWRTLILFSSLRACARS